MRLVEFIQANREAIETEWEAFARSRLPAAAGLSHQMLRDHIEQILAAITRDMELAQSPEEQAEKSRGYGTEEGLDLAARGHAGTRLEAGFRLDQVVSEFRALRGSVLRLWDAASPETDPSDRADITRFSEAIDQALTESMRWYSQQIDRHREQFLAILGHDLRNPLGAIITSATILTRVGSPDERQSKAASGILRSATRMSRMVNELLDLTRTQLGAGIPVEPAPMDLDAVCRQVLDELRVSHPDRELRFASSGDLHGAWDSDRLAQVVSNLAANAVQHGEEAAAVIVTARAEGEEIVLAVHNEGPPIPPEDLGSIFEPLVHGKRAEQAGPPTSLGLGLYIVREIVTAHHGTITVTSSLEQGTTFTVRLPRCARQDERSS